MGRTKKSGRRFGWINATERWAERKTEKAGRKCVREVKREEKEEVGRLNARGKDDMSVLGRRGREGGGEMKEEGRK